MSAQLACLSTRLAPPEFAAGSVWLAGAGPGDPGLLTLHTAYALAAADVVLHDALVAPEILTLIETRRIESVGKRAAGARTHQMRINQRLIALARKRLRVLRLKGGDPLIFGRGGEEAMALAAAGIPFRIIPGVSAGIGGTATAGIPLTHRMVARSVAFATGHDLRGELPPRIGELSSGADVLVFYMALRHTAALAERLIAAGRQPDEAVAFISNATTAAQSVHEATLRSAGDTAATLDPNAPTLVVIGPVLALRAMIAPQLEMNPMRVLAPVSQLSATGASR